MGLIATLDFSEYEYEYRDAEYEYEKKHDVLTPCQIVCDPLSRGVDSGASQKRTTEDFGATLVLAVRRTRTQRSGTQSAAADGTRTRWLFELRRCRALIESVRGNLRTHGTDRYA